MNSLLPKSVTTAIAVSISESAGGLPGLTAASVCVTGIEGAMLAPLFAKLFHVTDRWRRVCHAARAAHAVGTSKARRSGRCRGPELYRPVRMRYHHLCAGDVLHRVKLY